MRVVSIAILALLGSLENRATNAVMLKAEFVDDIVRMLAESDK